MTDINAPSRSRWVVLGIYAWIAGLSQMLWLNFAPILSHIEKRYGIPESTASLLLIVFPLTYVLLSIHAGSLTDSKGYRYAIGLGAILMAVFACLRIYTGNFWFLLVAQTGISLGQPYVVNGITKLVGDWFPAEMTVLATGLGTAGLFIGMAIGMAATPPLLESLGLSATLGVFAVVAVVSCAAFLILCPKRGPHGSAEAASISREFWSQVWGKSRNGNLLLLFFISLIGLGYFNGLTSWIEAILAPNGMSSDQAGMIGGVLIFGGIFGSVAIPALADRFRRRKPFLLLSICIAAATLVPLCRGTDFNALLTWGFLQGFFFLPAYALLLDTASLEAGPRWAGSATGVLMLTGNAGGVLVIWLMGTAKGEQPGFPSALYILLSLLGAALIAAVFTREHAAGTPATRTS